MAAEILPDSTTPPTPGPKCQEMPVRELHDSTWYVLGKYLDSSGQQPPSRTERGLARDWRGLAEMMNCSPGDVEKLQSMEFKTKTILLQSDSTVSDLWRCLVQMERRDIWANSDIIEKLETDCNRYHERLLDPHRWAQNNHDHAALIKEEDLIVEDNHTPVMKEDLVVDDVMGGKVKKYDAFLSFCEADKKYARHLIRELENVERFSICINMRDMLPGACTHFATAQIMAERCSKVIVLLSPDYLRSPECDFQLKVAQQLSVDEQTKTLLPLLYRDCPIPQALCHVHSLKCTSEYFWNKLTASLLATYMTERTISSDEFSSDSLSLVSDSSQGVPSSLQYTSTASTQVQTRVRTSYTDQKKRQMRKGHGFSHGDPRLPLQRLSPYKEMWSDDDSNITKLLRRSGSSSDIMGIDGTEQTVLKASETSFFATDVQGGFTGTRGRELGLYRSEVNTECKDMAALPPPGHPDITMLHPSYGK